MNFNLTDEQKMFQKTAKEFAVRELEPIVEEVDKTDRFPLEVAQRLARSGLMAFKAPAKYGGLEAGCLNLVLFIEQVGYYSWAFGALMEMENSFCHSVAHSGTEEQKEKYIRQVASGQGIASFAFTEPETGSDPKALKTTGMPDGDYYVLNGTKRFITAGDIDGPAVIFAKDDTGKVSSFIVEKNKPGYKTTKWNLLGAGGMHSCDIILENYRVPKANLLGQKGRGWNEFLAVIPGAKLETSAATLGLSQAALDAAIKYAQERKVREQPIASMMSIQWMLAEMAIRVEAGRWIVYRTAFLEDQGVDITKDCSIVKLFTAQAAEQIVNMAIQVHGAYGFTKDYKVERLYRDARAHGVLIGVSETQRSIISQFLLA